MNRLRLARTNFYRVFPSRCSLLLQLLENVGGQTWESTAAWWISGTGSIEEDIRLAIHGLVETYSTHAHVFTAIVEATPSEPELARAWYQFLDAFADVARQRIELEVEEGRSMVKHPAETGIALAYMTEAFLRREFLAETADRASMKETLVAIWTSAIRTNRH